MTLDLRTPTQKKWAKIREEIVEDYKAIQDIKGSNWQKAGVIAPKFGVTQYYVGRLIATYLNETAQSDL